MTRQPKNRRAARPDRRASRIAIMIPAIVALLGAGPAAAQWNRQSPIPTFLDVRGIAAPTAQRVFLATSDDSFDEGGALFESADGGANWVQRGVPFSLADPLSGIFFLDGLSGWAYGNANYRTTDGGTNWTELPFLGSTYAMTFYTATFGFASGNFGRSVSRDGGLSWSPSPNDLFGFDFADAQTGLGISAAGLFRTSNGGTTFAPVFAGDASAVKFLSTTVAVGIVNGNFVRSTDGGGTWGLGASAEGRTKLTAVSSSVVLAWGRGGEFPDFDDRVLRSGDGGLTWSDLGEILGSDPYAAGFAFAVPDVQTVVASDGLGGLLRSGDAGLTWTRAFTSVGPRPSFFSTAAPVFPDALTGYFGLGPGLVLKTIDGGATWAQISSGSGESLTDIDRFPSGDLIAVGEHGTLLTSTGASPWLLHESFATSALTAVAVVGPQAAVALDDSGRVYRSADGGGTWTAGAAMPFALQATDLHFTTLLDGWVIGSGFSGGALFHTTDGGDSWTAVPDFMGSYASVDFEGSSGWAANVSGSFYRSEDQGATWTGARLPGSSFWITDMDFFDAGTGYAVGGYGYAARSDDGGVTWQVLPTPNSSQTFSDLHLLGPNELWVSTRQDVAYYSASGGQSWSVFDLNSEGFGSFAAITALPGGDAWMVGYQGAIHHFTGPPPPPANRPPVASFSFVAMGLSVALTDASTDPDGTIVSRLWDFGDGSGSTELNPTHLYASANTYIVRLTVTDDDGASTATVRFIAVQPGPGGTFGEFTEVTPLDPLFVTPQDEDFWVVTTASADYDGDGDLDVAVLGYYVVYNLSVEHRLVLLRNDGAAGPAEWEFAYVDVPLGALSAGASDLAWGDADGDGDQDLVVGTDGATVLFRNDLGTLMLSDTVLPGYEEDNDQADFDLRSITWADYDNDGDQDLVVGTDGATVLFRNDLGTLVLSDTVLPGYYEDNDQADFDLRSITWADYDNDGDLDLLLPSSFDEETFTFRTVLLRNDGPNGTGGLIFTADHSTLAPTAHAQSSWADYDGDQDLDLLLVNIAPLTEDGFIRRYRNDGGGNFVGEDILGSLTVEHGEAQWGDYDADGDLDILVAGNIKETDGSYNTVLRIYRNDSGTHVPIEVVGCVPCEGWFDLTAATWADYDSDGDVDILLAGTYNSGSQIEGRAKIYDNQGGVFIDSGNQLPAPRASGSRGGTFTWFDLDGDGDLDYFIAGQYFVPGGNGLVEAQMHLYRNDAAAQNAVPSAPTGLTASVNQSTRIVRLSWNPASDDLTSDAALTYDLVVHRDGLPVASPHHLPGPGSISTSNEWVLAGLPHGSYSWLLRAVDSAYNGGPLAQGAFNVGTLIGVEPTAPLPRHYEFSANVPNPFTGSTAFRFALPERATVKLDVYNLAGRLVTRLVDETRDPGFHEVPWDASGLASGAYFVRLSTEAFTETRRIVHFK